MTREQYARLKALETQVAELAERVKALEEQPKPEAKRGPGRPPKVDNAD